MSSGLGFAIALVAVVGVVGLACVLCLVLLFVPRRGGAARS